MQLDGYHNSNIPSLDPYVDYDPSVIHTVESLAHHWHVNPSTIYGLIKSGKLQAFKVGVGYRITDKARYEYEIGVYPMHGSSATSSATSSTTEVKT